MRFGNSTDCVAFSQSWPLQCRACEYKFADGFRGYASVYIRNVSKKNDIDARKIPHAHIAGMDAMKQHSSYAHTNFIVAYRNASSGQMLGEVKGALP